MEKAIFLLDFWEIFMENDLCIKIPTLKCQRKMTFEAGIFLCSKKHDNSSNQTAYRSAAQHDIGGKTLK